MSDRTDWFKASGWGVMTHWLSRDPDMPVDEWNRRVDAFDVEGLAKQLAGVDCSYLIMTIGQLSGHYCSPNATYDALVGIEPSKCSQRDLIADLSDALAIHGIRLMTYLPSHGPDFDTVACERLGWEPIYLEYTERGESWKQAYDTGLLKPKRLAEFQIRWESVVREWSLRWKEKVSGWWIDGCKFCDEMYRFGEAPNFESFAAALRAGNARSILAFNPSMPFTPVQSATPHEDYTAGHDPMKALNLCKEPTVDDALWHTLSFLGAMWGRGEPRFCDELAIGYTKDTNLKGGVLTWDVPIQKNGLLPDAYVRQLGALGKASKAWK